MLMARPLKFTKAQVSEALEKSRGLRSVAAAQLGCSYTTLASYINRYPDLVEIIEVADVSRYERALSKLDERIDAGDPWAVQTMLRHSEARERTRLAEMANGDTSAWRRWCLQQGINPDEFKEALRLVWRDRLKARAGAVLPAPVVEDTIEDDDDDAGE